ncbi:hypothetical protein Amsp01_016650 [Amycolatopsis sp. NBRC 101858]|uniref:DUF475 domain-containing protein n=1 Tax=Amycolatopsis sp. NBRC 101858 TaxID=3032200 RepID=UPI0024A11EC6|nr:DUF475 domain-containing protein [Amycolatopsis sp. NBRC 101858]GLY35641.1 hypothetical protein Amsp01_016650 [Amycolatopsis sp. NBRC 101858]
MVLKTFGGSLAITAAGLLLAFWYGGTLGLAVVAVLAVLEISLSFDNAVVNAGVLARMNRKWQRLFLTVGILVAVVGMRLLFPVVVVCLTAKLSPVEAYHLAMAGGDIHTPGTYASVLHEAHPAIAAFGGVFLLMLFLNYIFEERELTWLSWLERPLARIGRLKQISVVVAAGALLLTADFLAPAGKPVSVLVSGALGLITYLLVSGLSELFEPDEAGGRGGRPVAVAGKAAFLLFLYLEVMDASFSFDGVVGAFAITSDPVVIAIGLGIGAAYIRALTVFLVRNGTLNEYAYLEHGAQWAIGALAVLLLCTIRYDVPEIVTGLVGVGFIGTALLSSVVRNRRLSRTRPAAAELGTPRLTSAH